MPHIVPVPHPHQGAAPLFVKTPNGGNKKVVRVTSPADLQAKLALFGSIYHTNTHVISQTADFGAAATVGADIVIATGGSQAHPLIITTPGAGNDVWTTRKRVYNSSFLIQAPWVWLYGLWFQMLPISTGTWRTAGHNSPITPQASNLFVTACRISASRCIRHDSADATIARPTFCYNWFEVAGQADQAVSTGYGDSGFTSHDGDSSGAELTDALTNLTFARNRLSDHPAALGQSKDFRMVLLGNGHGGAGRLGCPGTEIAWNFCDASVSHCVELKRWVSSVHHNHLTGRGNSAAAFNTRGENANGPSSGVRPTMYANRASASTWQMNATNWDYVNNVMTGGPYNLFPFGDGSASHNNNIGGADGCRLIGCTGDVVLGYAGFEPDNYTYGSLGSTAPVMIAAHAGGNIVDDAGTAITFAGTPAHPSGTYAHLVNSAITKQTALVGGFSLETPPVLNATVCGPNAAGRTWAGAY